MLLCTIYPLISDFVSLEKVMSSVVKALFLFSGLLLLAGCEDKGETSSAKAPQQVRATQVGFVSVMPGTINLISEMPGRTVAYRKADVRPQVDGIIVERNFTEGGYVEAGQQLYLIDQARYKAELDAANANLANARATLDLAAKTRSRYEKLLKSSAASAQSYDDAVAAEAQGKANVAAAKATADGAQINLNYTKLTAPISGQIGASSYSEGALVTASQAATLSTITQLDPIYIDVTQAGGKLLHLKQAIAQGRVEGFKEGDIEVRLVIDATGQEYGHVGKLQFSEVTVDETTGTVRLRAVFPNPDKVLLPGMFVRSYVSQGRLDKAYSIPQKSVMRETNGGAYVYLIDADNKIVSRRVQIEQSQGQNWVVTEGLNPEEKLVVDGLQRVAPGQTVAPVAIEDAGAASQKTSG